jgi:xanthine dehydrogenase accessory factor
MTQAQLSPDQIPEIALAWLHEGRKVWLATVVETWGSAPRPPGSQMVVDGAGGMMGSVSGGCVEGAVVAEAMAGGPARLLTYGVADEEAFAVGLACGGTIRILLEPVGTGADALPPALLADLVAARAAGQAVALVTDLTSFARSLVAKGRDPAVDRAVAADKSAAEAGRFVAVHNPALRLFVVGAVQIAQSLVPMARALGHRVTLIDPRSAFGSAARFPGEALVEAWPDEALPGFALDARSALVTLTHDAKLDDPAIAFALRSEVYYLGCLGSTRTHAKRLERLRALGFAEADLARIHAPAGLNIGAKSPAEIALSIMAEITQVLRKGV